MLHLLVAEKYGGRVTWDELGLPVTETRARPALRRDRKMVQ